MVWNMTGLLMGCLPRITGKDVANVGHRDPGSDDGVCFDIAIAAKRRG